MNIAERRMELFEMLRDKGVVSLTDAAERFGVSSMTVRRDLQFFEKQGVVTTSYGNAYLNKDSSGAEPSFVAKSSAQLLEKQAIGKLAAEYVQDGDSIIIDCGTTALQVLKYVEAKRVTVITNSMPVSNLVAGNSKIKLIYAPGEYRDVSAGLLGDLTVDFFRSIHVKKAFLGAHGCSFADGVTEPTTEDVTAKRAIFSAAEETFLLVDSSKFGHTYLMQNAKLSDFDHVITDEGLGKTDRAKLRGTCKDALFASVGGKPTDEDEG